MASINKPNTWTEKTHEGAPAARLSLEQQLERSVLACMLWEKEFYEDGTEIATRIKTLAAQVDPRFVRGLAVRARTEYKLRHAPLMLLVGLAEARKLDSETVYATIQRADEITELLALWWKDGKRPIPNQMKRGIAEAFSKFDEYQLARYQGDGAVKLRDALFLTHPRSNGERSDLYRRLAQKELATPDTWEVALSGGADKAETFTRLMRENRLGYMALLRNLRNMQQAGVERSLIAEQLMRGARNSRALPFRFVSAAKAVPQWEDIIEPAMMRALEDAPKLPGRTILLVDVSASMDEKLSARSDLTRMDAACALAMLAREVCEEVAVCTFSYDIVGVPPRRGFALRDSIINSQPHGGTNLGKALEALRTGTTNAGTADRIIVFTDEQSSDRVGGPIGRGYMVNVASARNGVGEGDWFRVNGFSEAVIEYIQQRELMDAVSSEVYV